MSKPPNTPKTIVFFHPDLGIGGAERLVVDAAVGLQNLGHKVVIYTSHRDVSHCFDEARDGTLEVRVRGALLPPTLFSRFKILFTILRHLHLLISLSRSGELLALHPDAFFVDQLAAGIPLMRYLFPNVPILFYCHFPDFLLAQGREKEGLSGAVKRAWRWPFDKWEEWAMEGAERVVVNSEFTRGVVKGAWAGVGGKRGMGVVYPCVDTKSTEGKKEDKLWKGKKVMLSINRFERKKDVGLALRAFAKLTKEERSGAKLVIAGGYDPRQTENVVYHEELVVLAEQLGLSSATANNIVTALDKPMDTEVLFLLSVPAQLKKMLLDTSRLLIYTPTNEHFGIVPLEAMLAGVPVLATNTGGPLETVVEDKTGWLRDAERVDEWTEVMGNVLTTISDEELASMGAAGKERVKAEFSQTKMAANLDGEIYKMVNSKRIKAFELTDMLLGLGIGGIALAMVLIVPIRLILGK